MKKALTLTAFTLLLIPKLFAQRSELRGHVYDESRNPDNVAIIELQQDSFTRYLVETDQNGGFQIKLIMAGVYVLKVSSLNSPEVYREEIHFTSEQVQLRDSIILSNAYQIGTIDIRRPVDSEQKEGIGDVINVLPSTNPVASLSLLSGAQVDGNGQLSIGKGKSGSTAFLREGNTPQIGPLPISNLGLEGVEVIDRGVSARYGGFTGGATFFKTAAIPLVNERTVQITSSSLFNAYNHNLVSTYFTKALKTQYLSETYKKLVLGVSLQGSYRFQSDPFPSPTGYMTGTREAIQQLREQPLASSETVGGYLPSASFVETGSLKNSAVQPNAARHDVSIQGKLTWNPTTRISLDLIENYNYINRRIPLLNNTLFNSDNNPEYTFSGISTQVNFRHQVKAPYSTLGKFIGDSSDVISSMYYAIEISHQYANSKTGSAFHGDDVFSYGYVGQFNTLRVPVYNYISDKPVEVTKADGSKVWVTNYRALTGYRDSLISFVPGTQNPELANYTNFMYSLLGNPSMQNLVQAGGLVNGRNIPLIYSLYANPGTVYPNYNKSYQERLGITAYGEASVHPGRNREVQHDFEFGMYYQQDRSGYYNLNAMALWQLMPLLVNRQITAADPKSVSGVFDENGRFLDTIYYNTTIDPNLQTHFDKSLRDKLISSGYVDANGKTADETTWIDINALAPSTFSMDMFSADELLNNGNSFASWSGFDHTGNKVRGKKGFSSFLNDPLHRPVDAYNPIMSAAWLQDKFVFRQLIVRAGFRFERFDANQMVMKDPYNLFPVKTVGEVQDLHGKEIHHPDGIGENFAVYVDNANNPNKIVGYRDGDQWYDASGQKISDPALLANSSSSGRIQPFLIDPEHQELTTHAFTSYTPQNLVLPRISVSFPLSTYQMFYVSYDKLAQNPDASLIYAPYTAYYGLKNNTASLIANANLKARIKTEYNIGFKQNIGQFASLNISAAYATIRNDFNQYRMLDAYPYSYTTYSNIDFSVIKRYFLEYEYQSGHISINASYALQFADGTGSNVNSAASLIQSGQPNLRSFFPLSFDNRHTLKGFFVYSFGMGKNYSGPVVGGRRILQNAFFSMTAQSISGEPYTATVSPVSEAQADNGVVQRAQIKGNPSGSRISWRHNVDVRFEKAFSINKHYNMSVYVTASNIFNFKAIQSVYSYTGLADDDGYLNSPQGQQAIRNQVDSETFVQLYRLRMNNPNNFGAPRNLQLGLTFKW
ncbi:MAG: hypothetical protein GC181_11130 [Bacteroidetes bacterium]|nr:hypothetical protein [Bacteroidota bacterium]